MNRKKIIVLVVLAFLLIGIGVIFGNNPGKITDTPEPKVLFTPSINYTYHKFEDLEFGGFMITQIGEKFEMFFRIKNHGEDLKEIKFADIMLYDSNGKELTRVSTELINLKKDETYQMTLVSTDDISSAVDFKVEYKN